MYRLLIEDIASSIDAIYSAVNDLEDELIDSDDAFDDEYSGFTEDVSDDEDIDIDESIQRTRVIRNGKRVIKFKSTKPGYRIQMVNGRPREVRMKPSETRKRKKGQKRAVRKKRSKSAAINRKRKKSMRKRTGSMKR